MKQLASSIAREPRCAGFSPASAIPLLVQRKCACGGKIDSAGGECTECRRRKLLGRRSPLIQTKLIINEPGDRYEQEADRVADQIMRTPESAFCEATGPSLTRGDGGCEQLGHRREHLAPGTGRECRRVAASRPADTRELLQRQPAIQDRPDVCADVETHIGAARQGGQALPQAVRDFFEPRFGHDFSQVRVHTDSRAAETARSVQARAFTVGQDLFFGGAQYAPETAHGKRLLAHELTHVVQQNPGLARNPNQISLSLHSSGKQLQREDAETEPTALEKLDAKLGEIWPNDEDILSLLDDLNSTEKQTVLDGVDYRDKFVWQLDDANMFKALALLDAGCETRRNWLKAEGVKLNYFSPGEKYNESVEECSLDQDLKRRVLDLCECLVALQLIEAKEFPATSACRERAKAHRLSTSYHILNDYVTLAELQAYLPSGPGAGDQVRDLDGNLWYVRGWTLEQTKTQATANWGGGTIALAYEGYEVGDPHRNPNTKDPKQPIISQHVYGNAMDVYPHWKKDAWDAEHNKIIKDYGLTRPIDQSSPYGAKAAEYWHFEKAPETPPEPPVSPEPAPAPPEKKPSIPDQKITKTANVRLVSDPRHWEEEAYILRRLAKGTQVEVLDKGTAASEFQWWKVRAAGIEGWVMQVLLEDVAVNP